MTKVDFIQKFSAAAVIGSLNTPLFPSVVLSQAANETGWGEFIPGNNLFGIKADSGWGGKVISVSTSEYVNGSKISYPGTGKIYANRNAALTAGERDTVLFRAYNNVADSFADRANFLANNPRYAKAGVFNATTPEAQAEALQAAGYATDPAYSNKLNSIINSNNLKSLDVKKKQCELVLSS